MQNNLSESVKEKLEKYSTNILKWNEAYNLLSSSQDKEHIWNRHILDSTQLHEHLPVNAKIIADLGSGAGFPGIVCSIMSQEKNLPHEYVLVESVGKKTNFLEDTIRILGLKNIKVRNERIEKVNDIKADVITARAFSKLLDIFIITKNIQKSGTVFLLHKGKNIGEEISEAKTKFSFDYQLVNSVTGDGFIFIAENVKQL